MQRKMLVLMLRNDKEALPTFRTNRWSKFIPTTYDAEDEKYNFKDTRFIGFTPKQLGELLKGSHWEGGWKYERSLKILLDNNLVNCEKVHPYSRKRCYILTDTGRALAEEIVKDMTELVDEWYQILRGEIEKWGDEGHVTRLSHKYGVEI